MDVASFPPFLRYSFSLIAAFCALQAKVCSSAEVAKSAAEEFRSRPTSNWPMVGGDLSNARHSSLAQINTRNAHRLGAVWVSEKFHDGSTSIATPVVMDDVMYITAGRRVYALDATTGRTLWSYKSVPDIDQTRESITTQVTAAPNTRGVAIGDGLIFIGLMNGYVIALKQESGELVWSTQAGDDAENTLQLASAAPIYVNGVILTGISGSEANLRGRITAIDALSGRKLWQLFTIPGPGEAGHETWPSFNDVWRLGGGGVWTNAAVDPELGTAYFTTANPVPAFAGDWRPGDNLYTNSVIAVEIRTGKLRWHYQLVHHDVFEADAGTPAIIYDDANERDRTQKAIAVLRADGYLFQLNRETGKPLLPVEERPVPQLHSQKTSPTQPFPINGESILMTCEEWKREKIPAGFQLGCMWTPPASPPPSNDPPNVLAPFPAVRISPMSYSPRTGYFYAQGTSILSWPRRSQDPYYLNFDLTVLNLKSHAHLAAIDSRTGKIAWKTRIHSPNNQLNYLKGGLLTTAGNLLFRGSGDGNVESYDARSGELLWKFQTGSIDRGGSPMSYEVDGRQYVAVSMGPAVWAFSLGGKLPPTSISSPPPSQEDLILGPITDTSEIQAISFHQQAHGSGSRYFIDEYRFNPHRARSTAGRKVMFVNNGVLSHEMVASDGAWSTGPLSPGQRTWLTFDRPGRHTYICKNHPWSYGQITIIPAKPEDHQTNVTREPDPANPISQAAKGRMEFNNHCSSCHGNNLEGRSMAPPLSGSTFASHWTGMAVTDLFDRIRTTMPPTAPGSLDTPSYLSIVAYLLQANDILQISDLTENPDELKNITIGRIGNSSTN